MEYKSTTKNVISTIPVAAQNYKYESPKSNNNKKKKKRSALNIFRAAALLLRLGQSKKKSGNPIENWGNVVGSIRPLHLQEQPLFSGLPPPATAPIRSVQSIDNFEDVYSSPAHSSSSGGSSRQYRSSNDLLKLDDDDDDDDKEGDSMIDAKAEEFIAQFYEQMRLQNTRGIRRA